MMKKKSFAVIGLGRFGFPIAKTLSDLGYEILAMDTDSEKVSKAAEFVNNCVIADGSKIEVLEQLGVDQIDHVVVAIGDNLQASILTVLNLKKLDVKKITVRADEQSHKEVFDRLGADEVIIPEEASAISLANQIVSDTVLDYYPIEDDYSIVKIIVGDNFKPQTLIDLNIRARFNINIVGIITDSTFRIPKPTDSIQPGDILSIIGTKDDYNKFVNFINKSE